MGGSIGDLERILLDKRLPRSRRKSAIEDLGRPNIGHRKAAVALEAILLDEGEDHRLRVAAARSLGSLQCQESMPSLLRALEGRCPALRHEVVNALGSLKNPAAVPALEKLLQSHSRYLRRLASIALINISGLPESPPTPNCWEHLFCLLASGDERVAEALMSSKEPARFFLLDKLKSTSFYERQLSSWALAIWARRSLDAHRGNGRGPSQSPILQEDLARLYSFRAHYEGTAMTAVENSGFDLITKVLCGDKNLDMYPPILEPLPPLRAVDLRELLSELGAGEPQVRGRTLVAPIDGGCLALKFPTKPGDEEKLSWEASIQRCLADLGLQGNIPQPLGGIIEVQGMPFDAMKGLKALNCRALAYTSKKEYFIYLNDPGITEKEFLRGLVGCASDLGRITKRGLIHRSLIPLFHKRTGALSRPDGGLYRWNRRVAGSLEAWVKSCRYPNFRLGGLADFEHVEIIKRTSAKDLHQAAGEHLLSLFLIVGSYFRSREDFDLDSVQTAVILAFQNYLKALTYTEPRLNGCIDWKGIASRMEEEMATGDHLGLNHGPFPLPEVIRAIHLASLLAVLNLTEGSELKAKTRA